MGKAKRKRGLTTLHKTESDGNSSLEADIQKVYFHAVELHQQGQLQEAAEIYQMILANKPNHADSLHYLGVISLQNSNAESGIKLITKAIQINSRVAEYHYNLATVYQENKQADLAIKHYKKTIKLQPKYVQAYRNMAIIFHNNENIELAKKANYDALKLEPNSTGALQNMATLLHEAGQYNEALKFFDRAMAVEPMNIIAHYKKSHIELLKGHFEYGWAENLWMFMSEPDEKSDKIRTIPFQKWNGEHLKNKRLLINADQGVGDQLMFMSCLPDVLKIADSVILECDHRLKPLLQRSFPKLEILPIYVNSDFYWNKQLGEIDYRVTSTELAKFFRKDETSFPSQAGYIQADVSNTEKWRKRLKCLDGDINIGISWQGGANDRTKKARSIPLKYWSELSSLPNVNLINLQYGQHNEEIRSFNNNGNSLHNFKDLDPLNDLDEFSALLSVLDLVISIDNTTVHFAGALGVPAWVILPHTPDWRWMLNRNDSPWYPTATLYRAEKFGFEGIRKQLDIITQNVKEMYQHKPSCTNNKEVLDIATSRVVNITNINKKDKSGYALLLNDKSGYNDWASSCSSLAIHDNLRESWSSIISVSPTKLAQLTPFPNTIEEFDDPVFYENFCKSNIELIEIIKNSDTTYINAETCLNGLNQTSLSMLYLAYIAKTQLAINVHLINYSHQSSQNSDISNSLSLQIYQKVYKSLSFISVRDNSSYQIVKTFTNDVELSFDCLPLFIESKYSSKQLSSNAHKCHDIIITGSSEWSNDAITKFVMLIKRFHHDALKVKILVSVSNYRNSADARFTLGLNKSLGKHCELLIAHSEEEWIAHLTNAQLLISGRHHHCIAAAYLSTPLIVINNFESQNDEKFAPFKIDNYVNLQNHDFSDNLYNCAHKLLETSSYNEDENKTRVNILPLAMKNFR